MSDREESPGGSEIFRHEERERELEPAVGDEVLLAGVDAHFDRHFPDVETIVFHELVSDLVHLDVHVVPPGAGRDWVTLVTSGMAQRPMNVPAGLEAHRHGELVLALPPDWPLTGDDDRHFWPIRLLRGLARLPHEYDTFLYYGHTVPHGDPTAPYAPDTRLCCACVAPPLLAPSGFHQLELEDGRVVWFYGVVLLHEDEMSFKLERGFDALLGRLDEGGVTELVQPDRPSTVAGRRRGLFRRR